MAVVGTAEILVKPTFTNFQREVEDGLKGTGTRAGEQGGKSLGESLATWGKRGAVVAGGAIAAVTGAALVKGFGRLTAIENAQAKLRGLGHDADMVKTIMNDALASVRGTAFGMDEAASTAAGAVAAGVKPGLELQRTLKLVADAATIGGSSMSEMGSIFNKVATSNKVQGEVIAQLSDRGIPIVQLLAQELGKSAEETVKLASEGKINFATFQAAMEEGLGGAALESGNTFSGAMKNVWAALGRIGANVLSGVFPKIAPALQKVMEWMAPLEERAKSVGTAIGVFLERAVVGVQGLTDLLVKGDFTGKLFEAFGWEEDAPIVGFLLNLRDVVIDVFDTAKQSVTAFVNAWRYNDGEVTSSGIPGFMERLGFVVRQTFDFITGTAIPAIGSMVGWFARHETATKSLIGVFAALLVVTKAHAAVLAVQAAGGIMAMIKGIPVVVALTRTWAAVQWLMNAALNANPVGIVVMALVALGTALVVAYKKSETFRNIVDAAWAGIKTGVAATVDWITNTAWPAVQGAWDAISSGAVSLWESIQGAWAGVKGAVSSAWDGVKSVVDAIVGGFRAVGDAAVWLWQHTMVPMWDGIKKSAEIGWSFLGPILELISDVMRKVVGATVEWLAERVRIGWALIQLAIQVAWGQVIKPVLDAMVTFLRDQVAARFIWLKDQIVSVWNTVTSAISAAWNTYIRPVFQAVGDFITGTLVPTFQRGMDTIKAAWTTVSTSVKNVWDQYIRPVFQALPDFILGTVVPAFQRGVQFIKDAWDSIKAAALVPVNFIIDTVYNNGIRAMFEKIAKAVGSDARLPHMATLGGGSSSGSRALSGGIQALARGGYARPGWKLVGEEGPELVDFRTPGRVYTAGQTEQMMMGGGTRPNGDGFGGPMDWISSAQDWVVGNLKNLAQRAVDSALSLVDQAGGGMLGQLAKSALKKALESIVGWAGKKDEIEGTVVGPGTAIRGNGTGSQASLMAFARAMQAMGARVSEHPAFGRVGRHSPNSRHYSGRAVDVNYGPGGQNATEMAFFDRIVAQGIPQSFGLRTIWRAPGHYNHLHADYDNGGWLQPGSTLVRNATGKPEAILNPNQWKAVERLALTGGGRGVTINAYGAREDVLAANVVRRMDERDLLVPSW